MKEKKAWFAPRWKGFFGPIPQTWQGWLLTIGIALIIVGSIVIQGLVGQVSWLFVVPFSLFVLLILGLLVLAYLSMKEK